VILLDEQEYENIGLIVGHVYIGVVYDCMSMQSSTIMVAHIDLLHSDLDHSSSAMCEGTRGVRLDG
jgi:hypothetical protein